MKNTAFLDKSADVRMMFFADNGFPMSEFSRLNLGPVVMKDEIEYYREIGLLHEVRVVLAMAGLSDDGSRFQMRNEIYRPDGKLAAKITCTGGWMDLRERRLTTPPGTLLGVLQSLPRTADFRPLPTSLK
jgi:acyl-CoA thioester hydrolase